MKVYDVQVFNKNGKQIDGFAMGLEEGERIQTHLGSSVTAYIDVGGGIHIHPTTKVSVVMIPREGA